MKHIKSAELTIIKPFSLAIVVSQFNTEVTQELLQGAVNRLNTLGFTASDLTVIEVPGAVEIPITAKRLARSNHCIRRNYSG